MTQPLRRVERIMLAMDLDDPKTFDSLSKIRKCQKTLAHGLDLHQIRHRDAVSPRSPGAMTRRPTSCGSTRNGSGSG